MIQKKTPQTRSKLHKFQTHQASRLNAFLLNQAPLIKQSSSLAVLSPLASKYFPLKRKALTRKAHLLFQKVLLKISFCKLRLQSIFQKEFPLNLLWESADRDAEVSLNFLYIYKYQTLI